MTSDMALKFQIIHDRFEAWLNDYIKLTDKEYDTPEDALKELKEYMRRFKPICKEINELNEEYEEFEGDKAVNVCKGVLREFREEIKILEATPER